MSEIKTKIESETKDIKSVIDKLVKCLDKHLESGINEADTDEVGKVADAIKDLADAKEKMVKCMYHTQIMEAMDENKYGEDYDEDGPKFYRGRNALGQYTHRRGYEIMNHMENSRDMDRPYGKMYFPAVDASSDESEKAIMEMNKKGYRKGYEEGHSKGYEEGRSHGYSEAMNNGGGSSRYDNAKRGYEEAQKDSSQANLTERMQSLQEMLNSISGDIMEKIPKMGPQEKQLTKNTLQAIINRA